MNPKILIIDDDEMLSEELAEILTEEGYSVKKAFDGREGLQMIRKGRYDLILLDIKMPHRNGFEVLKEVKRSKKAPKVLVLSANPLIDNLLGEATDIPQDDPQNILELADDMMNKPYDVEALLDKIRDLAGEPRLEK